MSRLPRPAGSSARTGLALSLVATVAFGLPALAQTPTGAQPTLPSPSTAKASPVVDTIAESHPALEVHRHAPRHAARPVHRHLVRYRHHQAPIDVERPALAGVLLVEPIPPRAEAPRPIVPMPAYFVDGIASALTIPPPPVVCERRRPDPTLPDPRLHREVPLECGHDID